MSILVVYGSKLGGTQGLAETLAAGLREEGFTVEVLPAASAPHVEEYDAVIIGGALYAGRWHRDARRFVKQHSQTLRRVPTYMFSSGPLDDTASSGDIAPVKGVAALMSRVAARGHMTFGGRLAPDATGFVAGAMAKKNSGDWRDPDQVRAWSRRLASELRGEAARSA